LLEHMTVWFVERYFAPPTKQSGRPSTRTESERAS
jgi:hypothetical protein